MINTHPVGAFILCSHPVPVAVKALLSVGHGTPVLVTGRKLFGGTQLSLDLGRRRAMKHH